MANKVFIATSVDGFIADANGGVDWLHDIPNPSGSDGGFAKFLDSIDAIVMGRKTYETVLGFGGDWPYPKPVFVVSDTITEASPSLTDKVEILRGSPSQIIEEVNKRGHVDLYIDGGTTIRSFLAASLIDELTITQVPIILGTGLPLFGPLSRAIKLEHVATEILHSGLVQNCYRVIKP